MYKHFPIVILFSFLLFNNVIAADSLAFEYSYKHKCDFFTGISYSDDWCNPGNSNPLDASTILLGDSFSNSYSELLKELSKSNNRISFFQVGRGQCPPLLNYGPNQCIEMTNSIMKFLSKKNSIKNVIISLNFPAYYDKGYKWKSPPFDETRQSFIIAFQNTIESLISKNYNIIVFLSPPTGSSPKSCIEDRISFLKNNNGRTPCFLSIENARAQDGDYRKEILPMLAKYKIKYFDPFNHMCDGVGCLVRGDGEILYIDGAHMSIYGGRFLANHARNQLNLLFK